jgi:hypothetical protein
LRPIDEAPRRAYLNADIQMPDLGEGDEAIMSGLFTSPLAKNFEP